MAAITGEPANAMCRAINVLRKRRLDKPVVGVTWPELSTILRRAGYILNILRLPAKPRPLRAVDMQPYLAWSSIYIIETRHHFMAMRDGLVVDNHTPNGEVLEKHPQRLMHIDRVAIVHAPRAKEREWLLNELLASTRSTGE